MTLLLPKFKLYEYVQTFNVSKEDKLKYGEIYSPFSLIEEMFDLFDLTVFKEKDKKWLDAGAGLGYFSIVLFDKLNKGLKEVIINDEERKEHIIKNMIYLVEIKKENINYLKKCFGETANIYSGDFLSSSSSFTFNFDYDFDYVIGNPPYNINGIKKVPTNKKINKKTEDGETSWISFIKKSISLLKNETGQLCVIVPSIWMKPDKMLTYQYLTSYKIEKLHCFTNTETNKLFKGEAQTPTCYFLLTKKKTDNQSIELYDTCQQKYVNFILNSKVMPIPLFGQGIINKLKPFIEKAGGYLKVIKTNLPNSKTKLSNTYDPIHYPYANIKTCIIENKNQPKLVINYSNIPQKYHGVKKIVLAHKMYGFPFLDDEGNYGISNRDNYIILNDNEKIKYFLSTKLALYIFESTRYRMKYLEKYAFEFIPDITKLPDFPEMITDKTLALYFNFTESDIKNINELHKKDYLMV